MVNIGLTGVCSEIMGKLEEISIWGDFRRCAHENDPMKKKKVVILERAGKISGVWVFCVCFLSK